MVEMDGNLWHAEGLGVENLRHAQQNEMVKQEAGE
jgi:hypothetical protein